MLLSLKTAPCNGGSSFLSLPRFCFYPISGPVQGTLARQSPGLHNFGALVSPFRMNTYEKQGGGGYYA